MAEVKILIEGYAKQIKGGWVSSSTVTLVKSNSKNIIIDPGCNREKLLNALRKEKLETKNIDFVLLTHAHTDHALLCGIFEDAKVLNPTELYDNDKQTEYSKNVLGNDIEIIQTSGHSSEHCSLIVKTNQGKYAVAGDVFWWTDDEKKVVDINKPDEAHPEEVNMNNLSKSRKKISQRK